MASAQPEIVFHHSPYSRSVGIRWLLEELGIDYAVHFVGIHQQKVDESYRVIQPHKKVPAIEHRGIVVTERAAIAIYLADTFTRAGLAPTPDDPRRAAYLTMLVYCDAVFDPCVTARARGLEHGGSDYSFGSFEDVMNNLEARLTQHPFAVGETFTAADTQLASSLAFTMHVLQAVPKKPAFEAYLARVTQRPAYTRAQELDTQLLAEHPEIMEALSRR
ncbi:MAG: glutathione S-transferase family protein [Deltaproteobacteria bacterium]|nr:glutathione S-transferase family protein [Nannocystaceae bacterium]